MASSGKLLAFPKKFEDPRCSLCGHEVDSDPDTPADIKIICVECAEAIKRAPEMHQPMQ